MKKWLIILIISASTLFSTVSANENNKSNDDTITLYFARHGKTIFNTFDRVQGWADSPLTEEGITVARYLGEGLKDIKFDSFYSSDAGRQRETMGIILKQAGIDNYHLTELPGLREAFFGGFEGGFNRDMANATAIQLGLKDGNALFREMKAGKLSVQDTQNALAKSDIKQLAENYAKVKERTQNALKTIINNAKSRGDKNVLIISSGTSIQIMISDLTDDPAKNKPLPNAAIVKIIYQNNQYNIPEIGAMHYVENGKQRLQNQ